MRLWLLGGRRAGLHVDCGRAGPAGRSEDRGLQAARSDRVEDQSRGHNRSAVLQGDPTKPGPYAVLLQWLPGNMSRPHFHPNDRFFIVVSGTWWVGLGTHLRSQRHRADAGRQPRDPLCQGRALRRRQGRAGDHPGVGRGSRDQHAVRAARTGEVTKGVIDRLGSPAPSSVAGPPLPGRDDLLLDGLQVEARPPSCIAGNSVAELRAAATPSRPP